MAVQIVIFLAFTSVTLVFNTLLIWFAYKAFSNVVLRFTDGLREVQASQGARQFVSALETASKQAVSVTEVTKQKIQQFGPALARAESTYGYGLAKVDVRMERLCDNLGRYSEKAQRIVEAPSRRLGAAMEGVRAAIEELGSSTIDETFDDASPTPSK